VAIILAIGIATIAGARRPTIVTAAIILLFAGAAAPNYITQRGPYRKGVDYSQVVDLLSKRASDGDCILIHRDERLGPAPNKGMYPRAMRALLTARHGTVPELYDPGIGRRAIEIHELLDQRIWPSTMGDLLKGCTAIWMIATYDQTMPTHQVGPMLPLGPILSQPPVGQVLNELCFHGIVRWQFMASQVVKFTRCLT